MSSLDSTASPRRSLSDRGWGWALNGAALLGLAALVAAFALWGFGARVLIFSSGSMSPTIPAGSVALTLPTASSELDIGDIVTVPRPGDGHLVTHRVLALDSHEESILATLKGDANPAPDASPYALTASTPRVVWTAPGIGTVLSALKSPWVLGAIVGLVIVAAIPTRPRDALRASGSDPEQTAEVEQ